MNLTEKIERICQDLADDLLDEYDKDKAMVLNNLCEYIMPKKQRTPIITTVSSDRNYKIIYEYTDAHGSTQAVDDEPKEV